MSNIKPKEIKKELKSQNKFTLYKNSFEKKSTFFLLTKISNIFESTISIKELSQLEFDLSQKINDQGNWANIFQKASVFFKKPYSSCNWKSFGVFMFYTWSISTFNENVNKNKSIYNLNNFNDLNADKMNHYNQWINSMIDTGDLDFNIYIRKVLKEI